MIILAIDPGTRFTGFCVAKFPNQMIEVGTIRSEVGRLEQRLERIHQNLQLLFQRYPIEHLVVEKAFFAKNPQSALKLGMARGIAFLVASQNKALLAEISPNEVKKITTGRGHASKSEVAKALKVLTGIEDFPSTDASDAMAIAYAYLSSLGFQKRRPLIH